MAAAAQKKPAPVSSWDSLLDQEAARATDQQSVDTAGSGAIESPDSGSWWKVPGYLGSRAVGGAIGLTGIPGTVAQAGFSAINALNPWGLKSDDPRYEMAKRAATGYLPTIDDVMTPTNALGITNNPALEEGRSLTTRLLGGAAGGAGGAALDIATGGALTPALISGAGGGITGEIAHEVAPENSWAALIAAAAGGYASGKVTQSVKAGIDYRNLKSAVPKAQAAAAAAEADFKRVRDAHQQAGWDADDLYKQSVETSKADTKATVDRLGAERDAKVSAFDTEVGDVATSLAPSTSLEDAGTFAQTKAREWVGKVLPKKVSALWAPVDAAIPGTTPVSITNFRRALAEINQDAGGLEPLAQAAKPGLPSTWQKTLSNMDEDIASGGKVEKSFTWKDVARFRTVLGDAMSNPSIIKDVGSENLSKLYATLTSDMETVAKQQGAGNAFSTANAGSKALYSTAERTFSRLVKNKVPEATDPLPGKAAGDMLRIGQKDSTHLAALRAETPEIADHLAAVAIHTGAWEKLSVESKAALIPDATKRSAVDFALASKQSEEEGAAAAIKAAEDNHAVTVKLAQQDRVGAKRGQATVYNQAKSASEAAAAASKSTEQSFKIAEANRPRLGEGLKDLTHVLGGGGIGAGMVAGGSQILKSLGVEHNLSSMGAAAIGAGLGYAVPKLYSGTKNALVDIATNPASRRAVAVGAAAGSGYSPSKKKPQNELTGE